MQHEETEERLVVWGPAIPGAVLVLILGAINFWVGTALTLVALGYLASRALTRRWGAWAWVSLGALVGAAAYWMLILLHALF